MSFVSDEYLASIKNMMRVVEWWCGVSFILALFGLVLSIVEVLPMWGVVTLLLTSLLLWLFTSLGVMRINYRITEINIIRALDMIKDEDLDPNHLKQFVDEFSNKFLSLSTKFRVFSFIELFIMFWGFLQLGILRNRLIAWLHLVETVRHCFGFCCASIGNHNHSPWRPL